MAYQRPFRPPGVSPFALQPQVPVAGQFFNTGQPMAPRPLLALPTPGIRMPPLPSVVPRMPVRPLNSLESFRMSVPPRTTIFVGNISEEVETELIQQIMEECGKVNSFTRMQGANGKPQAFAFCEFDHPDATRRALRLLNGFMLGGKPLNIKLEDKMKERIREFMIARQQEQGLTLMAQTFEELPTSDYERDEDLLARNRIVEMIGLVDKNLLRPPEPEPQPQPAKVSSSSDSDSDHRKEEDDKRSSRKKHSRRSLSRSRRSRSRSPHRSSRRDRDRDRDRIRGRDRDRSPRSDKSKRSRKHRRSESVSSNENTKDRSERSKDKDESIFKRDERQKAKERESAYQRRLKKWEDKEIRVAREVARDKEKEAKRRKTIEREAKKLKVFHEDYDDDIDDAKYYKGDNLIQRRRAFDAQKASDAAERLAEKSDLDAIRKEILETSNKYGVDADKEAQKRFDKEEAKLARLQHAALSAGGISPDRDDDDSAPATFKNDGPSNVGWESIDSPSTSLKIPSLGKKINVQTARVEANGFFADDNEEEQPKKKLKPFQISSEERIAALTPEERKRMIRDLIDTIPKSREQIFNFPLKWDLLDGSMIDNRIRPWITKKVQHYIGEDEPALVGFMCDCITNRTDPKKLVLDLSMVLDEEADSFITKMWRLMIYETEARHIGLSGTSGSSSERRLTK